MSAKLRPALFPFVLILFLAAAIALVPAASANDFLARFTQCDLPDGTSCLNGGGGVTPPFSVGTTFTIRIFPSALSGCDGAGGTASTVDWGDGSAPTTGTGNAYHTHRYDRAGSFIITMRCGGYVHAFDNPPLTIGGGGIGGLGPLDPSGSLFVPTMTGLVLGLVALGMANAKPPVPAPTPGAVPGRPAWWRPRLRPGIPASMAQHVVSLRDIPLGAVRVEQPRIAMEPGKPTDPFQKMHCPRCGGPLGYTVAGWFCLNPGCAPGGPQTLFPQVGQAYGPPPMAPPPPPPP